jgi:hypothetical protein
MSKLIINGFEFPSQLQARCAIAHICENIVLSPEEGVSLYTIKSLTSKYYNSGAINNSKSLISNLLNRSDSPTGVGKLWTVKVSSISNYFYRVVPNEYTVQVANMLPEFEKIRKENQTRGEEYRAKKVEKVLTPCELHDGDIIKMNKAVWDLGINKISNAGYPDSYFTRSPNGTYHNPGLFYKRDARGIFMGSCELQINENSKKNVGIVMWFGESQPMLVDIRAITKA